MDASPRSRTFFDTNVLVYAFDGRDPAKQQRAGELLSEFTGSIVLSSQVLGEFYWTTTRRLVSPLTSSEARTAIREFRRLFVVPIDEELVERAIDLCDSTSIAYWDALIIKAASSAGCTEVLTEDLNHGQVIDGIRVENPFVDL